MYITGDFMCQEIHRRGSNEMVFFLIEPTDERCPGGIGVEDAIHLFMEFDIDRTCWLDGTQILPGVVL